MTATLTKTLIWTDDFESYTPASGLISPWTSNSNTIISTAIVQAGSQSMGFGANGNNSSAIRPLGETITQGVIDCYVYIVANCQISYIGLYSDIGSGTTGVFIRSDSQGNSWVCCGSQLDYVF